MPVAKDMREFAALVERLSPEARINAFLSMPKSGAKRLTSLFVEDLCKLKEIKVLSPSTARGVFTFKVHYFYCNGSGNLHGGAQAAIFDVCTSLVLQSIGKRDFWINAGVSRVLTVNYLRPAPEGTELDVECEVVHAGKSLSMLRGVMKRADDGAVISTCEHNKAAVKEKPEWKL